MRFFPEDDISRDVNLQEVNPGDVNPGVDFSGEVNLVNSPPTYPSPETSETAYADQPDTRTPLKLYHPAKANIARHSSSLMPVWLLSNPYQIE